MDSHGYEAEHYDRYINIADHSPTVEPNLSVEAERLHCAPEAVREVKPDSGKPKDVKNREDRILKRVAHQAGSVSCRVVSYESHSAVCKLSKHHVVPEVEQVEEKAQYDDNAQHKHIARVPVNLVRSCRDSVAVVATCLAVLKRQDDRVDKVYGN